MGALEYAITSWDRLLELSLQHALWVLVAVGLATLVGGGLGVAFFRHHVRASLAVAVCATILTIPSFALLPAMLPVFGLGNLGPAVALTAYALLPIVRNTVTGLQEVDPAVVESARGMGMSPTQALLRVQLPLAWPVILAGLRVATMIAMSIWVIASYVGGEGLGDEITRALSNIGSVWALDVALAATVTTVILALVLDGGYQLLGRATIPKGVR